METEFDVKKRKNNVVNDESKVKSKTQKKIAKKNIAVVPDSNQSNIQYSEATEFNIESAVHKAVAESSKLPIHPSSWGVIGAYCQVYWEGNAEWFEARVILFDPVKNRYFIHYNEDSTVEWIDFDTSPIMIADRIQAADRWPIRVFNESVTCREVLSKMSGYTNSGKYVEYFGSRQYFFLAPSKISKLVKSASKEERMVKAYQDMLREKIEIEEVTQVCMYNMIDLCYYLLN
jgi:hypothetical protein